MGLYDHFRKEELPFVERALEMLSQVERRQTMRLTDFLDPRQFSILQSLSTQVDQVKVTGWGGYPAAERVRALICPDYLEPDEEEYQLVPVEIKGNQRFVNLTHRDLLGAFLGAGLKREKFGDILLTDDTCQAIVAREIFPFIQMQITQVHRIPVELIELAWDQLRFAPPKLREKFVTVASARVDALTGEVYNMSRSKVLAPIRAGKVKVNWKVVDDPSHLLKPGDIVSVAGSGRFVVQEFGGTSRSGRLRVTVGIYD